MRYLLTKLIKIQISTIWIVSLILLTNHTLANNKLSHQSDNQSKTDTKKNKSVIYQNFTRLFGNKVTNNKPWGTIEENGVGKFNDFTPLALKKIKDLGVTHIWFTGILHHAVIRDYTKYGITNDDPDVVKGRAGSPYAVKDYYDVDPDLAIDPAKRMAEFESLIQRSHNQKLKVIIDIVPNHVARNYQSTTKPKDIEDFGEKDDKKAAYARENNFYYLPGEVFKVPIFNEGEKPLGGATYPMADGEFEERPAKWTGNGSRLAQPKNDDWYETVKVNYGVRPDGTKDFPAIPAEIAEGPISRHAAFWKNQSIPGTWKKFRDICLFWLNKGVDGFRFDMAEMVPVEFWSYLNSTIKTNYPNAILVAEVYNPTLYREYLHTGKMDYLYDKVGFYDTLKKVMLGKSPADRLAGVQGQVADIEGHMLHFLENHDEQRIASPDFAGDAQMGKPAMVVSTTIGTSPMLVYFGQEVGEKGEEMAGYGKPSRTSIYDYIGVPAHQRWMNNGLFDGGGLSAEEKELRQFYERLLNFALKAPALMGSYEEIQSFNREQSDKYPTNIFSFVRWSDNQQLIVVASFDRSKMVESSLYVPRNIIKKWNLKDGKYLLKDCLSDQKQIPLIVKDGIGSIQLRIPAFGSLILEVNPQK